MKDYATPSLKILMITEDDAIRTSGTGFDSKIGEFTINAENFEW